MHLNMFEKTKGNTIFILDPNFHKMNFVDLIKSIFFLKLVQLAFIDFTKKRFIFTKYMQNEYAALILVDIDLRCTMLCLVFNLPHEELPCGIVYCAWNVSMSINVNVGKYFFL